MLSENWLGILLLSFCVIAVTNGLLASCTTLYYRKQSSGRLSHSQLRIKQGNATFEHRLNVFAQALSFSFFSPRIYMLTAALWLAINAIAYSLTRA